MNAFTVRRPADFIALCPLALGFTPDNSLVMMTLSNFHARIDLPLTDDDVDKCVDSLLYPAVRHKVTHVAFLMYDGSNRKLQGAVVEQFMLAGIEVIASLEVQGSKFREFGEAGWEEFDIASHPFTLEAQYQDAPVRHKSRAELVESIRPRGTGWPEAIDPYIDKLRESSTEEWVNITHRGNAAMGVEVWRDIMRGSTPDFDLLPRVALLLALNAWLSGDGALALEALEYADKDDELFALLFLVLDKAVPPDTWPISGEGE